MFVLFQQSQFAKSKRCFLIDPNPPKVVLFVLETQQCMYSSKLDAQKAHHLMRIIRLTRAAAWKIDRNLFCISGRQDAKCRQWILIEMVI
jgi:hypothetical protein